MEFPGPWPGDGKVHAAYAAAMLKRDQGRRDVFHRLGIAEEHTTGNENVLTAVFSLLEKHRSGTFTTKTFARGGGTRAG